MGNQPRLANFGVRMEILGVKKLDCRGSRKTLGIFISDEVQGPVVLTNLITMLTMD